MQRPFFDAHVHFNTLSPEKLELARTYDAHCLSINTDISSFPPLREQQQTIRQLQPLADGRLHHICSFNMQKWGQAGWAEDVLTQIEAGLAAGARGVKIWKSIGMDPNLRLPDGRFLMVDDPVFDPIFEQLQAQGTLVIGHQGEPRNCWLPLEQMTVDSDREYFAAHPQFHMYRHPEFPSYEEQIRARDRVLEKFPRLRFVGLHLLSLEYKLDEVARRLDAFPNLMTDLAERIAHVQLQTRDDRERVRDFFIRYQDRIIYGTDVIDDGSQSGRELADRLENLWKRHWEFFATDRVFSATRFSGEYRGLDLPEAVLRKIFYANAHDTYLG